MLIRFRILIRNRSYSVAHTTRLDQVANFVSSLYTLELLRVLRRVTHVSYINLLLGRIVEHFGRRKLDLIFVLF